MKKKLPRDKAREELELLNFQAAIDSSRAASKVRNTIDLSRYREEIRNLMMNDVLSQELSSELAKKMSSGSNIRLSSNDAQCLYDEIKQSLYQLHGEDARDAKSVLEILEDIS